MIVFLLFAFSCRAWQIVDELCTSGVYNASVLPASWCVANTDHCKWLNITCDASGNLLGVELWNVPLNAPLMHNIDAPGPQVATMKFVNCGLTGTVPMALESVSTLTALDLSNNALTGNFPWQTLLTLYFLNIANNKISGKSTIDAMVSQAPLAQIYHLNLANNTIQEEWNNVLEATLPGMAHFNIENNQFYGIAPAFLGALEYKIDGNYFVALEVGEAVPYLGLPTSVTLAQCDMSRVPFRRPPPAWVLNLTNYCGYTYNPTNHEYMGNEFTPSSSMMSSSSTATLSHTESISTSTAAMRDTSVTTTTVSFAPSASAAKGSVRTLTGTAQAVRACYIFYFASYLLTLT